MNWWYHYFFLGAGKNKDWTHIFSDKTTVKLTFLNELLLVVTRKNLGLKHRTAWLEMGVVDRNRGAKTAKSRLQIVQSVWMICLQATQLLVALWNLDIKLCATGNSQQEGVTVKRKKKKQSKVWLRDRKKEMTTLQMTILCSRGLNSMNA